MATILDCGHRATARAADGRAVCAVCAPQQGVEVVVDLRGREARCTERCPIVPSDPTLAFFEYRGPGSRYAVEGCRCGYSRIAHEEEGVRRNVDPHTVIEKGLCIGFRPRGPHEYDLYYDGCRGWD